jgi:hypothetical protein
MTGMPKQKKAISTPRDGRANQLTQVDFIPPQSNNKRGKQNILTLEKLKF